MGVFDDWLTIVQVESIPDISISLNGDTFLLILEIFGVGLQALFERRL